MWFVPDHELHVTLDVVADRVASEISETERDTLLQTLRQRLAEWPQWTGTVGSALAYRSGAILDVSPAAPLAALAAEVRSVLTEVRGQQAGTYRQPKPHVSVGYCYEPADSDPWQSALRHVDPAHARLLLDEVALVEVRADPDTCAMHWTYADDGIRLAQR